jgi:aspartyl-tRNA(Asn)/glutamyl-tRNA(Gln) amidotransferase subunit A
VPDYQKALTGSVEGLKIGLPTEFFADGLDAGIRLRIQEVIDRLKTAGATFQDVSLPYTHYGIATYYILTTAEASSNLARYDGVRFGHRADIGQVQHSLRQEQQALEAAIVRAESAGDAGRATQLQRELDQQDSILERLYQQTRAEGFGPEVKRRIMLGTYVLSAGYYDAYYGKAQQVRTLIRQDFERVFEEVDVLLTPTTPTPAFKLGSKVDDPLEMYLSDIYTVTGSLAGIPGLVVPIGSHPIQTDLPVGLQLMGPHFREDLLLQVGDVVLQRP